MTLRKNFIWLLFLSCLTGCVSLSDKVDFQIFPDGNDFISMTVYVTRVGFYTNIHGGPAESYYFKLPRNKNVIGADQIRTGFRFGDLKISDKSQITFIGNESCSMLIELFGENGKPMRFSGLSINGTHEVDPHVCKR